MISLPPFGAFSRRIRIFVGTILLVLAVSSVQAKEFRIGISPGGVVSIENYTPLKPYLERFGIEAEIVEASSYPEAARLFQKGEVDAMFCGAGLAGALIIKKLGFPLLRPVGKDGRSTVGAAILARRGAPPFNAGADYFKDKKVSFCKLAAAGEFFFRSLSGAAEASAAIVEVGSHSQAIWILSEGMADTAIVKDRVWDQLRDRYPHLAQVGRAAPKNPEGTLIVSRDAEQGAVGMLSWALVALEKDQGSDAAAVRESLGIERFALTSAADYGHIFELLKKAGVGPEFEFERQ